MTSGDGLGTRLIDPRTGSAAAPFGDGLALAHARCVLVGAHVAELMWWADFFDTHVSAPEMTVDGRPPRDSFSYRATSPLVEMSWVEDSVLGIDSDL